MRRPAPPAARRPAHALRHALAEALAAGPGPVRLLARERIKRHVHRLRFETREGDRSFVLKRLSAARARRNELVIRRWLPAAGFGPNVPALLGVCAEPSGRAVWHVYEDLGPWSLGRDAPPPEHVAAAARTIAELHARFADQPLLSECRLECGELGDSFLGSSLNDAARALRALRPPRVPATPAQAALRDRLLARLEGLLAEWPARAGALAAFGGPSTLLHGDLWRSNAFVEPGTGGAAVRLIDWDHAGVGPAAYDLSTFLLQFPREWRPGILGAYRGALGWCDWVPGDARRLNEVFDTAQVGRCANRLIWPTLALLAGPAPWAFAELAEVERWLEPQEPPLPIQPARAG